MSYREEQCKRLICEGRERAKEILACRLTVLAKLADALALSRSLEAAALIPFTRS